jgi:peptide chain release factor 1
MLDILEKLEKKHRELTDLLYDRGVLSNKNRYKQVAKEHKDLSEIMELVSEYRKILKQIEDDEKIKNDSEDQELVELAKSELEELYPQKKEFENYLKILLLPKDPHDV